MEISPRISRVPSLPLARDASLEYMMWMEDRLADIGNAVEDLLASLDQHVTESHSGIYRNVADAPFSKEMLGVEDLTSALMGLAIFEGRYLLPVEPLEEGEIDPVWERLGYERDFDWSDYRRVQVLAEKADRKLIDMWTIARDQCRAASAIHKQNLSRIGPSIHKQNLSQIRPSESAPARPGSGGC